MYCRWILPSGRLEAQSSNTLGGVVSRVANTVRDSGTVAPCHFIIIQRETVPSLSAHYKSAFYRLPHCLQCVPRLTPRGCLCLRRWGGVKRPSGQDEVVTSARTDRTDRVGLLLHIPLADTDRSRAVRHWALAWCACVCVCLCFEADPQGKKHIKRGLHCPDMQISCTLAVFVCE